MKFNIKILYLIIIENLINIFSKDHYILLLFIRASFYIFYLFDLLSLN